AEPVLSAGELRDSAHRAIAEERFDDATVLALRSLVRDLEVRTLLDVTVGMTAHAAAASAPHSFPDLTSRLQPRADAFPPTAYSHRAVTAKQAEDLLRLTEYIAESTPDLTDSEPAEGDQFAGVAPCARRGLPAPQSAQSSRRPSMPHPPPPAPPHLGGIRQGRAARATGAGAAATG